MKTNKQNKTKNKQTNKLAVWFCWCCWFCFNLFVVFSLLFDCFFFCFCFFCFVSLFVFSGLSVFSFCEFPSPSPRASSCLSHFFLTKRCVKNIATKDHQSARIHQFQNNISSRSTIAPDMHGILRCFCPSVFWTSALSGQGSRTGNCFKMATQRRSCRAEVFYCNLKRGAWISKTSMRSRKVNDFLIEIVLQKETQLIYISVLRI